MMLNEHDLAHEQSFDVIQAQSERIAGLEKQNRVLRQLLQEVLSSEPSDNEGWVIVAEEWEAVAISALKEEP